LRIDLGSKTSVAVIIPARNEENFIDKTLAALFEQYVQPDKVVVVNDGSNDMTAEIALTAGAKVVNVPDRGYYVHGMPYLAAVINYGLKTLQDEEYGISESDYVLVLGADHTLVQNYIGTILNVMEANRSIAICSGQIAGEHSVIPRGSGRIVRAKFWRSIGFRYPENFGFETYLLIKAQQQGYNIEILPNLVTQTLRKTGINYKKSVYISYGKSLKALGYSRIYSAARIGRVSVRKPKGGFYMFKGYMSNNVEMYDRELRSYLSTIQHKRIKRYIRNPIKAFVDRSA
jgi:glycosyltransferase involved in cell wall biosynthesis